MKKSKTITTLVILFLSFIWGSTWVAIRFGLEEMPPFLFASCRFFLATFILYVYMAGRGLRLPKDWHSWRVMLVLGFFQAADYMFVFWGEQYVNAGIGAILFATMPFFVVILNFLMAKKHEMTWTQVLGIAISFLGVVLIFADDLAFRDIAYLGGLAMIIAAICGAYISVFAKLHANAIHPVTNTFVQMTMSALLLGLLGLITNDVAAFELTWTGAIAIVYLGLFGSAIAFVLYMWVIREVTVIEAAVIPLLTPIAAVVLGWLVRDEQFGPRVLTGGFLILFGVYLVNVFASVRKFNSTPAKSPSIERI
ncbi:MAG: EamA family transporter [Bacteroidetes bacterium]|nr:EamA family transporter [Bacteroidota bacterium]